MKLNDEAKVAVRNYLQSVVVIDDGIGVPETGDIVDRQAAAEQLRRIHVLGSTQTNARRISDEGGVGTDFSKVVDGFFAEGVVCALHKCEIKGKDAEKRKMELDKIVKICRRVDVSVLDWFVCDKESIMRELIEELLKGETGAGPERHTMVVYTQADIESECLDSLRKHFKDFNGLQLSGYTACIIGTIRLIFFSKRSVHEVELASKVIESLAKLNEGILPTFALHSIAAVKRHTKRLLERFDAKLDPEFVLNAFLTRSENDVRDVLNNLIAEELLPIIEDDEALPRADALYEMTAEIVQGIKTKRFDNLLQVLHESLTRKKSRGCTLQKRISSYMIEGCGAQQAIMRLFSKECDFEECKRKLLNILRDLAIGVSSGSKKKFGAFSVLMCMRNQYSMRKSLCAGTIVEDLSAKSESNRYLVCIMPVCDSRRLNIGRSGRVCKTNEWTFPFWRLSQSPIPGADGIGIAVYDKGNFSGSIHKFVISGKYAKKVCQLRFKCPDPELHFDDKNIIETAGGKKRTLLWCGQLKPLHAQRIAQYVGRSLAKVGLVESEWMRLYAAGGK